MIWNKRGLIYSLSNKEGQVNTHAQLPIPLRLNEDTIRVYFSARDNRGRAFPTYIDINSQQPRNVKYVNDKPLISLGELGAFDDNGVMASSLLYHEGKVLMYYIGWSPRTTVPYSLAIGLAVSEDGGRNFSRFSKAPILDRSMDDPFFVTSPCVIFDDNVWKMWYASCTGWELINNRMEHRYTIKFAHSDDGIEWRTSSRLCIEYMHGGEAICCPFVIKEDNIYKMWYSKRGIMEYRSKSGQHYNIGYAESKDGLNWVRKDDEAGIDVSESGWDSEMIAYCGIYEDNKRKIMLYNGNGFGQTGIGYAELGRIHE